MNGVFTCTSVLPGPVSVSGDVNNPAFGSDSVEMMQLIGFAFIISAWIHVSPFTLIFKTSCM